MIRIVPPVGEAAATAAASPVTGGMVAAKPVTTARIEARPVDGKAASAPAAAAASVAASSSSSAAVSAPDTKPDVKSADEPAWTWPANGPTIAQFEEGKRKGLVIGGKAGFSVPEAITPGLARLFSQDVRYDTSATAELLDEWVDYPSSLAQCALALDNPSR